MPDDTAAGGNGRLVLFSIKPQHAQAIYNGEKKFEYRRVPPSTEVPYGGLLYESGKSGQITGHIRVVHENQDYVGNIIDQTADRVPHTADELRRYFRGCDIGTALQIGGYGRFDPPIPISFVREFESDFSVPQNFRYIERELFEKAQQRAISHVENGGLIHQYTTDNERGGDARK